MRIIFKDIKKRVIKLSCDSDDELWMLSTLIKKGAEATAKTTRKIKLSEKKVEKKVYFITIEAEKTSYENQSLRINGKVISEIDDIPKGSSHTLSISINEPIKIKQEWRNFEIKKIEQSSKSKTKILTIIHDREECMFAELNRSGYKILSSMKGDVQKKYEGHSSSGKFYESIIKKLEEYKERFNPESIIIASPAFFSDDLISMINNDEIKKKIVSATCSDVSEGSLNELMKRPELTKAMNDVRARKELEIVEKILEEIGKEGKQSYGINHVKNAVENGAVETLLISTATIDKYREEDNYNIIEELARLVESSSGKVEIISSRNDAGKKLDGIGGIAALLRYKI